MHENDSSPLRSQSFLDRGLSGHPGLDPKGDRRTGSKDFRDYRSDTHGSGMISLPTKDSNGSQPLTRLSRNTFSKGFAESASSRTSMSEPRLIRSAFPSKSTRPPQQSTRELTYNASYQPEQFDTPLHRYRRLGQLLNGTGHMVAGGMNEGIFVIERTDNKQKFIEKRLPIDRKSQRRRTRAEIDALTRLRHAGPCENINKIHESFFPGMTNYSCLILSFCELGSITDYISRKILQHLKTPESFAWHVLESVVCALVFCHYGVDVGAWKDRNAEWTTLCHLDVKPDNIWLTMQGSAGSMPRVVLGDFGCSVSPDDIDRGLAHALMLTHGTPRWLPPEAKTMSNDGRGRYGKATDIWQAGGTIQTMCRLTKSPEPQQAAARRPCGSTHYSRKLNSIVASCMEEVVSKRPSAVDCYRWIQDHKPEL